MRARSLGCRAGSAPGTNTAMAAVKIDQRPESPTPDTELGEHPAHRRADDHADAPHRRHQRRRPCPQPARQGGIDHRVAEACEHSAGRALHGAGRPAGVPWSGRAHTQACPRRRRQGQQVRRPRPEPDEERVDRGRRDDRADQVHRDHPCVEPLATDVGDRAGQQADGEELVGRVQRRRRRPAASRYRAALGRAGHASCPAWSRRSQSRQSPYDLNRG